MGEARKRIALVNGGSRGMGRAHVVKLAEMGFDVGFTYLDGPNFADSYKECIELAQAKGANVYAAEVDCTDYDAWVKFVDDACRELGSDQIDVLVNVSGLNQNKLFIDSDIEFMHKILDICLYGDFVTIKAVLPHMTPYKSGCIINTGSVGSLAPLEAQTAYCAAKKGIIGLTQTLQVELAPYGIRVNTLAPGATMTDMTKDAIAKTPELVQAAQDAMPAHRFAEPEEQAEAMAFLVNHEYMWGATLPVNGGEVMV